MAPTALSRDLQKLLLTSQKNEITEHHIYQRLAKSHKDESNSRILEEIAADELAHYHFWKKYTEAEVKPNRWKVFRFYWISRIFGITFGVKLMERGEEQAQVVYDRIRRQIPEAGKIVDDEDSHERKLLEMLDEERLKYIGSMVLGLNDALVELTGALAGLSFAMRNTRLIALAGLITGVAASFSMAASEYLSTKSEEQNKNPLKSSIYTGVAYIFTVIFLIFPYLIIGHYLICLAVTIFNALLVISVFTYYVSVAKDLSYKRRFFEMAAISLGVALFSFGIGYVIRLFLGVDI
jgi:VIT1/CCC1 family predicted Fe2+/Mn2+ transporter